MTHVLRINKRIGISLKDIELYLKTDFKNYDYAIGFLDGYLFDNYKLVAIHTFEIEVNSIINENYYYKFITIK